jgi:hypothetical protein
LAAHPHGRELASLNEALDRIDRHAEVSSQILLVEHLGTRRRGSTICMTVLVSHWTIRGQA